jgi:hypothetical protein
MRLRDTASPGGGATGTYLSVGASFLNGTPIWCAKGLTWYSLQS